MNGPTPSFLWSVLFVNFRVLGLDPCTIHESFSNGSQVTYEQLTHLLQSEVVRL